MLSDEEKKAFESVKDMFSDVTIKDIDEQSITIYGIAMLDVIKVLTIVEKQSKEIEELKEINEEMGKALDEWNNGERTSIFHIHKDKIKATIEELEKLQKEFPNNDEIRIKIIAYKELLEKE